MARESIAMSADEMAEFVGAKKWIVLGTLDEDASPRGDVVASLLDGERLIFSVSRGTRASANIERDARVVCMTDQYPAYYEIKGVTAHGRAEREENASLAERLPADPLDGKTADRQTYAIPLDDVTSFDFTKINAKL